MVLQKFLVLLTCSTVLKIAKNKVNISAYHNWPWWPSGLSHQQCSHKLGVEDFGSNPIWSKCLNVTIMDPLYIFCRQIMEWFGISYVHSIPFNSIQFNSFFLIHKSSYLREITPKVTLYQWSAQQANVPPTDLSVLLGLNSVLWNLRKKLGLSHFSRAQISHFSTFNIAVGSIAVLAVWKP